MLVDKGICEASWCSPLPPRKPAAQRTVQEMITIQILLLFSTWGSRWSKTTHLTWLCSIYEKGRHFAASYSGECWRDVTELTSNWVIPGDIYKGHCEEVGG